MSLINFNWIVLYGDETIWTTQTNGITQCQQCHIKCVTRYHEEWRKLGKKRYSFALSLSLSHPCRSSHIRHKEHEQFGFCEFSYFLQIRRQVRLTSSVETEFMAEHSKNESMQRYAVRCSCFVRLPVSASAQQQQQKMNEKRGQICRKIDHAYGTCSLVSHTAARRPRHISWMLGCIDKTGHIVHRSPNMNLFNKHFSLNSFHFGREYSSFPPISFYPVLLFAGEAFKCKIIKYNLRDGKHAALLRVFGKQKTVSLSLSLSLVHKFESTRFPFAANNERIEWTVHSLQAPIDVRCGKTDATGANETDFNRLPKNCVPVMLNQHR